MKILITTAYSPSPRTRTFVKDLVSVLPGSLKLSRGKLSMDLLGAIASDEGAEKVIIVKEYHGNPSALEVYEVRDAELHKEGTIKLKGVTLSSERGKRVYNVRAVGVRAYSLLPGVSEVVEKLSKLLGLPLVQEPGEASKYDLIMDVEPREGWYEVLFRTPGSRAPVGPALRVREVVEGEG